MDFGFISEGLTKLYDKLEGWGAGIIKMLPNLVIATLTILVFWGLGHWGYKLMRRILKKTHFNESLEHLLASIFRIAIVMLGVILALAVMDLQKTVFSMLAGVGVVGLALGFAFQDLAANFMAGVMLAVKSPVNIGDMIEINGTMGKVIRIRLRETLIRDLDGHDVFIPNKDFTTNQLINYTSNGRRRIEVKVGIGYEDNAQEGIEVVRKALTSVDGVLSNPAPEAYVVELGGSSVNIVAHLWFKYPEGDYLKIQSEATVRVKEKLEASRFNIPFPIRTLQLSPEQNKDAKSALG